jgi:hypothetical protein
VKKHRIVNCAELMAAFEQNVQAGDRCWPEMAELEKNGFQGWVPIFDSELEAVALVPAEKASVMCEVMNRFEADMPIGYSTEDGSPVWEIAEHQSRCQASPECSCSALNGGVK